MMKRLQCQQKICISCFLPVNWYIYNVGTKLKQGKEWGCNQTKGFKAPVSIAPDISVFASKWIDNLKVNRRNHWKLLNHYCEKNFSYINDINFVWRGYVTCTNDWKKNWSRKCACIAALKCECLFIFNFLW